MRVQSSDTDLPGCAAATAVKLLGQQADPELLSRYTESLARRAADTRKRGSKMACVWMSEPADDEPLFTEIADSLAPTLRITT